MKLEQGQLLFSATDLAHHLSCRHLTELERQLSDGLIARDYSENPQVDLLAELGKRHEKGYLGYLRDQGLSIVELPEFAGARAAEMTRNAMSNGIDVIAQGALEALPWRGRADFLVKTDMPSGLGDWSYEVVDTKLAQTTRATTILQLCLYTELRGIVESCVLE